MRRIDILIGFLILAVLGGVFFGVRFFADPDRKFIRNEDAEVIDAALLQFYEKSSWRSGPWERGDFIVINPQCKNLPNESFSGDLAEAITDAAKSPRTAKDVSTLAILLAKYPKSKAPVKSRTLNLKGLRLDPKIVIREVDRYKIHTKNRHGEVGSIRVNAWMTPPLYSDDHEAAIVNIGAAWGRHSSSIQFVLRRIGGQWTRVYTQSRIYP